MADTPAGPTAEQLKAYADGFNASPNLRHFGLRVEFPDTTRVRAVLDPVRPEHRGGLGGAAVNGGVLAAIFDLVLGCAPALVDPTRRTATIQLSMSFFRAVTGDRMWAEATVDRAGGSTLFASARIYDGKDQLCATCQGVVRVASVKWAAGTSPAIVG